MSSSDSRLTYGRRRLIYTDGLPSHVGQWRSHATLNKCVRQDGWRRAVFSWGGRKCCLAEIQGWWNGSGSHFSPPAAKGLKGEALSRKGLNKEIRAVLCLCVTSVHSHHIRSIQFDFIYKASLTIKIVSRFTWQKRPLLQSYALSDFKDFCKCVRMRWNSLRADLNMKTKCLHANNMSRQRQISLGILIHEKAGTISAQSSSVIQSQRLWCERGNWHEKGDR